MTRTGRGVAGSAGGYGAPPTGGGGMGGPGGPPPGGGGAGLAGGPSPGGGQGGLGASGSVGAPNGGPEAGDKEDTGPLDVWVRVTLAGRPKTGQN